MLDNITKKNIDDCRDVLVGKVPDPKSQIEQITLALIYKFMDDMDKEAVEKFGGKAKFFTGEYERYGWRKLFDPSLSGADMLVLYSEALEKLNTNPNIPELFRNIFKNAYLPYRDPGTLKLFLKYINEFEYSHSEKLGDAFEYLLSVMGSQGDAGQFRTPRHIIDFVTACVNPQKNETVLDPACGTAGFLLSAYKHILNEHTDKRQGDKLKPEDRKKLATNFVGYDISPDMVRLSLANMYLHGFATPNILEYDTLSSEDRWNETYDVILANPPFMTPKGGIRPHKKFGVQANKAEVLFTDYIAEHLNPNGRAGIVVPNGIVATSQTAYKELRKHLITDSLIAVISLPAGCFNPYSGVKTSVLILDKRLAKKGKHVLFLKIENDGFDLGAQRREHDKNDLPEALRILHAYKARLKEGIEEDSLAGIVDEGFKLATLVEKGTILANKDVVLNADRYSNNLDIKTSNYERVTLGEICDISTGKLNSNASSIDGKYPFFTCSKEVFKINEYAYDCEALLLAGNNAAGVYDVKHYLGKFNAYQRTYIITIKNNFIDRIIYSFIKYQLEGELKNLQKLSKGAQTKYLTLGVVQDVEIIMPPIELQEQIVAEIEGYQKVIDGAKMVVNNYKPTISVKPEWEVVELGEVCEIKRGRFSHRPRNEPRFFNGKYPFIQTGDVVKANGGIVSYTQTLNEDGLSVSKLFKPTIVLVTIAANIGDIAILNYEACFTDSVVGLRCLDESKVNPLFLGLLMQTKQEYLNHVAPQVAQKNITVEILKELRIEVPPIQEQVFIVKAIEEEMEIVEANKRLIGIFEEKVRKKIGEVWGSN